MDIKARLIEKTFTDDKTGEVISYLRLEVDLYDGEKLELKLDKKDVKMLKMAQAINKKNDELSY